MPDHTPALDHRGPLRAGDLVQLTDPKGRHHTFQLVAGKQFFTHKGSLDHDDLIGRPEGSVLTSTGGVGYLAFRPLLNDFVLSMKRGAAIIYPKDAAAIVGWADVFPGARVIEAGAGSGALSCSLIRAVGPAGRVHSFEVRPEFAEVARANVGRWFGGQPPTWSITVAAVQEALADWAAGSADIAVLDMLAPWDCLGPVHRVLEPGGVVAVYVATTTQMSKVAETMRAHGGWTEPQAQELMLRTWHLEGLAVRPDHRMIGHTGFLLRARRLADAAVKPVRRTRPAKGAYGEDYTGPNADGAG